jgi:DNA-binding transcriptional MerR regulator
MSSSQLAEPSGDGDSERTTAEGKNTYTVREVAQKEGISTYAVRYYDNHGLIPFVKRDEYNNRVFDERDLQWVHLIACLRQTGMPIEEVKHYFELVLQGDSTIPERYQIMIDQQRRTVEQLEELNRHLVTINKKVAHYADVLISHSADSYVPADAAKKRK